MFVTVAVVPVTAKSAESTPVTPSLKVTRNTKVSALVRLVAGVCRVKEVVVGAVLSMVYTCPVKGSGLATSWERPVSFAISRPSVPSPVPVLAVTVHVVDGGPLVGVTPVMAGVPASPLLVKVKLLLLRLRTASANVTVHETEFALVGLLSTRLIERTVVSGRSTGVVVGSLTPPMAGSSVETLLKLLPEIVP